MTRHFSAATALLALGLPLSGCGNSADVDALLAECKKGIKSEKQCICEAEFFVKNADPATLKVEMIMVNARADFKNDADFERTVMAALKEAGLTPEDLALQSMKSVNVRQQASKACSP